MSRSRSIPEELIRIKAQAIWKKRQRQRRNGTPQSDWEEARQYLQNHQWEVFFWEIRHPNSRDFSLEIVKTFISAFGLAATIFAGVGLYLSYQSARVDRELTQERLITDRFGKAVEQLGKEKDTTVRIGGIYALERIANDSDKDFWTIMEVLTSYVRENSSLPPELRQNPQNDKEQEQRLKELENLPEVNIDVQTALTVIGRRTNDPEPDRDERIDLTYTNLKRAYLWLVNLQRADLRFANLRGAYLESANLREAYLGLANLQRAYLELANLQRAYLKLANLQRAYLKLANLQRAYLKSANLREAYLGSAKNLTPEQIKSACFWDEAIYKGEWNWNNQIKTWVASNEQAKQDNTKFIEELKKDKSSDPKEPVDCSLWEE